MIEHPIIVTSLEWAAQVQALAVVPPAVLYFMAALFVL